MKGKGCTCNAWSQAECCCNVDWRSAREVELEHLKKSFSEQTKTIANQEEQIEELEKAHEQMLNDCCSMEAERNKYRKALEEIREGDNCNTTALMKIVASKALEEDA